MRKRLDFRAVLLFGRYFYDAICDARALYRFTVKKEIINPARTI